MVSSHEDAGLGVLRCEIVSSHEDVGLGVLRCEVVPSHEDVELGVLRCEVVLSHEDIRFGVPGQKSMSGGRLGGRQCLGARQLSHSKD